MFTTQHMLHKSAFYFCAAAEEEILIIRMDPGQTAPQGGSTLFAIPMGHITLKVERRASCSSSGHC